MTTTTTAAPQTPATTPPVAPRKRTLGRTSKTFYWMTVPAVLLFFVLHTVPVLTGIFFSFTNYAGYGSWDLIGFSNYLALLQDDRVWKAYGFTFGFAIVATGGTQRYLVENGVACDRVNKVLEGRPHVVDSIKNGDIQLVLNTTEGAGALSDSRSLRRAALLHKVPYYTTLAGAMAAAEGIQAYLEGDLRVRALQEYFAA